MAKTGSKSYDPAATEKAVWELWQKGGYFHPQPDERGRDRRYCIMIPLPNVTAALHLGHALNNTLQDILIRQKRMAGCNTLWMIGTDHAGIATQAVVEKNIRETEGKSRHDLGPTPEACREELVRRIWEWKHKFGGRIIEQLKIMGCSGDYQRERFTLDEGCAKAVRHTFFKLFRDGLIYRGKRLVNWDTQLKTAVADDEVYHETVQGHFYHFKYPIISPQPGEPTHVRLATTRPETMLGDTAVAVHPEPDKALDRVEADLRARLADASTKDRVEIQAALDDIAERHTTTLPTLLKLRDMAKAGRMVMLPLVNRPIPLICDEWAKPELGSGCVKITPAHDPNDYEVGQRHKLPMVNVLTEDGHVARIFEPDGTLNANSSRYEGLEFDTDARKRVVEDMQAAGLIERIEDRQIEIGHSDRSKTPIEPFLSDQWFVKMGDLTKEEAARVESTQIKDYWKSKNLPEPRASDEEPRPSGRAALRTGGALDSGLPFGGSSEEAPHSGRGVSNEPKYPGLAQLALDAVASGKVRFFPERYARSYLDWLAEKRDWCISRQLWWGHRIPVWHYRGSKPPVNVNLVAIENLLKMVNEWTKAGRVCGVPAERSDERIPVAGLEFDWEAVSAHICVRDPEGEDREIVAFLESHGLERDPDVLDTWFSSALWPHSTLGWPDADPKNEKSDLGFWYPTSVLITAREIITLWVARMVMTGLYNLGEVPFRDVIIHSVIQDGEGRKMSKTLGNGVDPQDIIEEYGADALRFTLTDLATETQDLRLPVTPKKLPDGRTINVSDKFEKGRNFCNKLWQAATGFVLPNLDGFTPRPLDPATLRLEDRWILSRLTGCLAELNAALEGYRFSECMKVLYRFMWDEYCSAYIEMTKPRLFGDDRATAQQVLVFVLDQLLRMLHPFIPFVTEAIWQKLNEAAPQRGLRTITAGEEAITIAAWPTADIALRNEQVEAEMAALQAVIQAVREIRTEVNDFRSRNKQLAMRTLPKAIIRADAATCRSIEAYRTFVQPLAGCDALEAGPDMAKPHGACSRVEGSLQIFVPVADLIDLAAVRKAEEAKLTELRAAQQRAEKQLANPNFVQRADPAVVAQARQRAVDLAGQIQLIEQHLADLT